MRGGDVDHRIGTTPAAERVARRLVPAENGCLEFSGARDNRGYGQIGIAHVRYRAHRVAWEGVYGPIPDGLCVLHRCDNPPCCNVAHLFLGTKADNNADMAAKGRARNGRDVQTHCRRGHELSGDNLCNESEQRRCRTCRNAGARERYAARKATA